MVGLAFAWVAANFAALNPLEFRADPPEHLPNLAKNSKSARSLTELASNKFRRSVGSWFDGKRKRPIEFVWLYAPEFAYARLKNLEFVEHWHPTELNRRWTQISSPMKGKCSFFVQLASAPKFDLLNVRFKDSSDPEQIENVRFVLLVDGVRHDPTAIDPVFSAHSKSPNLFEPLPWYQFAPNGDCFVKEFDAPVTASPFDDSPFSLHLFRVDFDVNEIVQMLKINSTLSLRVISRSKERKADYRLDLGSL